MTKTRFCIITSLVLLAGCAENKYIQTTDRLCPSNVSKTDTMAAAEKVLAEMHFSIDKFDVNTGYIRTNPLPGAQSFEFWRQDNVGSFNNTEANLHSIRRSVVLNISEQEGQFCINCKATTQRLSLPEDKERTSRGYPALSRDFISAGKLNLNAAKNTQSTWIDLGPDKQLETEIIKRIENQLIKASKDANK